MAGDINKQSCEFMADIMKPQITKILNTNKGIA